MSVKERIKEFTVYQNITIQAFEKSLNVSNGYVNSIAKNIGIDKISTILENYPNLNLEWLLAGKGDMLKNIDQTSEPAQVYKLKSEDYIDEQSIPLYNVQVSAGLVTLFSDSNQQKPIDYINVPNLPKCDGAVYVTGDSMYPLLKNGDMVMYKQVRDFEFGLIWGEMYIVNIDIDGDDYISVKWLHKSEKGDDWIKLVSENRHHAPKDYPMSKVRSMALVKATLRINSMS